MKILSTYSTRTEFFRLSRGIEKPNARHEYHLQPGGQIRVLLEFALALHGDAALARPAPGSSAGRLTRSASQTVIEIQAGCRHRP